MRERGAAVADFVLVTVILLPLVIGVLQVALTLYVRNTMASAASQAAREAAAYGSSPAEGARLAREQIAGVLPARYADGVAAHRTTLDGAPAVEVEVRVKVPALGLGGPAIGFTVAGRAVLEHP